MFAFERERERERQRERETERETERQRQTDRQTDRQAEIGRERDQGFLALYNCISILIINIL